MTILRAVHFPSSIGDLLRTLSKVGFFARSLLIGSWVMPIYQELYGASYALRTLGVTYNSPPSPPPNDYLRPQ